MAGPAGVPQPPLSVSHHGAISCLEQEQKVAQDDLSFLRWHTRHTHHSRAPAAAEEGLQRRVSLTQLSAHTW